MITAADIKQRLAERFPLSDGWITMAEVTPPKTSRRFDVIAIMGWNSRGHEAQGFEVKIARSDWLRELNDPKKAEPLVALCSRYWIVAPPGVVEAAELPPAWGLLVVHPEQIRTGKQAQRMTPEPWSDEVWRCMLLRCATRQAATPTEIEAARSEGFKAGVESEAQAREQLQQSYEERQKDLRDVISQAEKATGVRLTGWTDFPALGAAMRLLSDGHRGTARELGHHAKGLREAAEAVEKAAAALQQAAGAESE